MEKEISSINEENEQVIYDALFMSEPEFCLIYGELYRDYKIAELKATYDSIRNRAATSKISYNRKLQKTRLNHNSHGDMRRSQGAKVAVIKVQEKKKEESLQESSPRRTSSLKEEILKRYQEEIDKGTPKEKVSKSTIARDAGCKYQYVYQTITKYEKSNEAKALGK